MKEIVTYVLGGTLEHKDSLGNGGIIQPGLVQHMSAGRGIRHSEFNPSADAETHLLQIWLHPDREGHVPGYGQRLFSPAERGDQLCLIASGDPLDGVVTIQQDARLFASILRSGRTVRHDMGIGRHVWVQVARGTVTINGRDLKAGDGVYGSEAGRVEIRATQDAELLLFDLA